MPWPTCWAAWRGAWRGADPTRTRPDRLGCLHELDRPFAPPTGGGDSRTGLATCDRTEFLTSPITPQITVKARDKVAARVCEVAKEIEAELIVIGLPLNMDGTEGERARKSRKLAKTVEIWSGLPVRMWDERQTTCAAADLLDESGTFGAKRKSILDSVSATVILDDYIQWRKEHPGEV